jgi:hypothetical protein
MPEARPDLRFIGIKTVQGGNVTRKDQGIRGPFDYAGRGAKPRIRVKNERQAHKVQKLPRFNAVSRYFLSVLFFFYVISKAKLRSFL